jgi:triosephosphate isomerase
VSAPESFNVAVRGNKEAGVRRAFIAGNWKMFGRRADLDQIAALADAIGAAPGVDVAICPPATLLAEARRRFAGGPVSLGAQDVAPGGDGAHTGDINALMLADAGARYVIVGHSERRADHGETSALVARKAEAALQAGLTPIICIGETLAEREAGRAVEVVLGQLAASLPADGAPGGGAQDGGAHDGGAPGGRERGEIVIAYEPVWAIGTGRTASVADISEIHTAIRAGLGARGASARILYGGSVKPGNAAEIFAVGDVDGALVGGASLKAADFAAIIAAHPATRA